MARRLEAAPEGPFDSETLVELTAVDRLPILLVDDRPENLRALEAVLELLGFPLQRTGSGSEALRLVLERDYALILLDVRMPGIDGLETARFLLAASLAHADVLELCDPADARALATELDRVQTDRGHPLPTDRAGVDLRLNSGSGSAVWVAAVASAIEPTEFAQSMVPVQWVDLTARRRAEQARAEWMLEHAARTQAEITADRLKQLQMLSDAIEPLALQELLPELALQIAAMFDAEITEVEVHGDHRPTGDRPGASGPGRDNRCRSIACLGPRSRAGGAGDRSNQRRCRPHRDAGRPLGHGARALAAPGGGRSRGAVAALGTAA